MMTHSQTQSGLDRLHAAMAARVEKGEMPGMVSLIAQRDDVHVDAIGVKALGGTQPMRRDTLFRIASMTKPILAAATMMLVEQGKLGPDDPVDTWLPELANRRVLRRVDGPLDDTVAARRPITLDDLLTFRMGFGHLFDPNFDPPFDPPFPIVKAADALQLVLGPPDPRTPHAPDEWIRRFGTLPLMYQPGERWHYNAGSLVLGVLLARVAGQPLGDLFRTRIFEPLGMHETGFWLPAELTQKLPAYYITNGETGQLEERNVSTPDEWTRPPVFPSGAGGLVSTVDDFLAFARMLLSNGVHDGKRLLSERSVELMTTNHLTPEQMAGAGPLLGSRGWGFGVGVVTEPDADWPVPGRYGWSGGYGTTWFNDPHRGIVAIAMTQVSNFLWNGGLAEFETLVAGI
jgi:CubicO group peptidase (beta-lactamase class C family)